MSIPSPQHQEEQQTGWQGDFAVEHNTHSLSSLYHDVPEDCTMSLLGYVLGIATAVFGPLMMFFIMKNQSKFVAFHALQAVVLQAAVAVFYVLGATVLASIGHLVMGFAFLIGAAGSVMAGLAAQRGEWFEFPVIGASLRSALDA